MKCDKDGVPLLIQDLRYFAGGMWFEVTFFNGFMMHFTSDKVCPSIGLMCMSPSRMQYLEAENNITKYAIEHWKKLFPHLKVVA